VVIIEPMTDLSTEMVRAVILQSLPGDRW